MTERDGGEDGCPGDVAPDEDVLRLECKAVPFPVVRMTAILTLEYMIFMVSEKHPLFGVCFPEQLDSCDGTTCDSTGIYDRDLHRMLHVVVISPRSLPDGPREAE